MASLPRPRDARRSPRVDVLTRIQGQLVLIAAPIVILNLSRNGFAVVSEVPFDVGASLDFRLVAENGVTVRVTAQAVQTGPYPGAARRHLTGFKFLPGRLTGLLPASLIDQLIDAVMPVGALL